MIAVGWPIGHIRMRRTVVRHTVVTSYAGRHRIWVFGLWLPLDPILLCINYHIGLDCFVLYVVCIGHWVQGFESRDGLDCRRLWGITMCPWGRCISRYGGFLEAYISEHVLTQWLYRSFNSLLSFPVSGPSGLTLIGTFRLFILLHQLSSFSASHPEMLFTLDDGRCTVGMLAIWRL